MEPTWESVRELYQALRAVARQALAPHALLLSEYHALVLCERGPIPLKSITLALGVTPAATTDLARRLGRRHLLRFAPHATDRRSRVVMLTGSGQKLLAEARRSHRTALRKLGVRLSAESRAGLERGVDELRRALAPAATPRDPR